MKTKTKRLVTSLFFFVLALGFTTAGLADDSQPENPVYPDPLLPGTERPTDYIPDHILEPWASLEQYFLDLPSSEEDGFVIEPRIIGGSIVNPQNLYPWMGSLQTGGNHYCGAVLIDPEWAVTSAHCWVDALGFPYAPNPDFDRLVLGEYSLGTVSGNEQYLQIAEVHIHPLFNLARFKYDIAVLKLQTPATLNAYVQPINLIPSNSSEYYNIDAKIVGWGSLDYPAATWPDKLQHATVQVLPNSGCSNYGSSFDPDSMICGGLVTGGIDACKGDSGGGMFVNVGGTNYLIGVTSWGNGCAKPGFPGIYARVASGTTWIDWIQTNYGIPSSHDDISNAKVIPSHPYQDTEEFTAFDTSDVNDPEIPMCNLNKGKGTIWYTYTPASNQTFYVETLGSEFDTFVAVWAGTPGSLVSVACNDDFNGTLQSKVSVDLIGGTTYYIEVGQYFMPLVGNPVKQPASGGGPLVFSTTTFYDVPGNYVFYPYIEAFYNEGITGGCKLSPLSYCPSSTVTREQMAVFILKAMYGPSYTPPPATGIFVDVPDNFFRPWIEAFYNEEITGGCKLSPLSYCPKNNVTREQMAIFILKALYGPSYTPPPATGIFADVPDDFFRPWIEAFYNEGITGGCKLSPLSYCPNNSVTRAQMAVFIDKGFNITPIP